MNATEEGLVHGRGTSDGTRETEIDITMDDRLHR